MQFVGSSEDFCAGYLQDDSDLEFSECSEEVSSDEGEVKRCRVPTARPAGGGDWSEDEFERDMESELMGLLQTVASPDALAAAAAGTTSQGSVKGRSRKKRKTSVKIPEGGPLSSEPTSSGRGGEGVGERGPREGEGGGEGDGGEKQLDKAADCYDKLYFETSSSEEEAEEGGSDAREKKSKGEKRKGSSSDKDQSRRQRLTDEELFYDPHMDEEDEQWVRRQRMAYHNVKVSERLKEEQQKRMAGQATGETQGTSGSEEGEGERAIRGGATSETLPKRSDAHLSCPACMTTVCIDCQQHANYSNQFRAMFVMNCRINREEVLRHVPRLTKRERQKRWRKGKRRRGEGGSGEGEGEVETEVYNPVHCAECNTEVAVYDKEEIFHFYNVLASAAS